MGGGVFTVRRRNSSGEVSMGNSTVGALELIEDAAIGEVRLLRLLPTAENFVDGEQVQLRKVRRVFLRDGFKAWAVVVLRGDFLSLRRVKEFEVSLRHSLGTAFGGNFLHERDWRLGEDAH